MTDQELLDKFREEWRKLIATNNTFRAQMDYHDRLNEAYASNWPAGGSSRDKWLEYKTIRGVGHQIGDKAMTLKSKWKKDGCCQQCGERGDFVNLQMVCSTHGPY